jgi:hypothetical protein
MGTSATTPAGGTGWPLITPRSTRRRSIVVAQAERPAASLCPRSRLAAGHTVAIPVAVIPTWGREPVALVHGCFWRQHEGCPLARGPRANTAHGEPKLARHMARDRALQERLAGAGRMQVDIPTSLRYLGRPLPLSREHVTHPLQRSHPQPSEPSAARTLVTPQHARGAALRVATHGKMQNEPRRGRCAQQNKPGTTP